MTFNTEKDIRHEMKESVKSFKPCYIWMTFNTLGVSVLPSSSLSFKPCYIWMTFNTHNIKNILTLMLSFKPCYIWMTFNTLISSGGQGEANPFKF